MATKKLPINVINEVKKFKQILKKEKLPITNFLVFGSFAKGQANKWSDIDVCVVSPEFKNPYSSMVYLRKKIPAAKGWNIEPVGFNPKDFDDKYSTFISEIKKYGVKV